LKLTRNIIVVMVSDKLYCYVDETGQDTKGKLFLVAIVLREINSLVALESELLEIEQKTGKKKLKWKKTSKSIKKSYLNEIVQVKRLKHSIFYSIYLDSKKYSWLIAQTVARTVQKEKSLNCSVIVIIDGLNNKDREVVRKVLKESKIKYRKIRGMRDEQSVFLRLADAMAGFLRDAVEGQEYTRLLLKNLQALQIVTKT
jgi:hypothetical protein